MKSKLLTILTAITLLAFPNINFGQVTLGPDASKFVLYTSSGAVADNGSASARSHLTGDIGNNGGGLITGFGNVNGIMRPGPDVVTTACEIDLLSTIAQINALPATLVGPLSLGNGFTITPGVWSIPGNATQTLDLFIDAQNVPSSQFIIKVAGTFSANTLSRVKLINGALACNIFWKIDGAVTMASLSTMRGNIISGGAILMGSLDSLEGRAFSTPAGAITIDQITAFTPAGCGSPVLTGPAYPTLGTAECYAIFTSIGALANTPISTSIGDVGSNGGGTVTGWTPADVTGTLHTVPDPSTAQCAIDVSNLYTALNGMTYDIELLYPIEFGRDLVLTPHVYLLNSALNGPATLTDSLYLDAQGNANAVFVFKVINGALSTSVNSRVKLLNGAQAKNVFWMVDGAVSVNNNSIFRGTIVVSAGAVNLVNTGIILDGRALTLNGAIITQGVAAAVPSGFSGPAGNITGPASVCEGDTGVIYSTTIISGASGYNWTLPPGVTITAGLNTNTITVDFTGASSGNFNITVQGTGSCSNGTVSVNFPVTVNALPIVTANANPITICAGSSTTLTGGGATSYIWSDGVTDGIGFAPTSTNTYTVTGTDANSCSNTATITVTVNSLPIVIANASATTVCSGSSVTLTGIGATSYVWTGGVINGIGFIPTSTNTYTVTGTNGNNCSDTATITVNVISSPTVTANANPTTVCAGSSVTLTGSGATSYVWTGGVTDGIGFVPASTNTYTVTGTTGSCSDTATITVNVISSPTVTANASATTVCAGTSVTLTGGGATSYVWTGGVTDGIGFSPASTNTYTVTGTDVNSCSNTATITVTVNSLPIVIANASATTVCSGSSITLTGSGATSYVWSGGVTNGIGFSPTSTNTYTVTGTNGNNCSDTATVTINVISLPVVIANASATTVCSGSSVTLTGSGATSYVWTGGVINGIGFVPASTNTYTVTGTTGSCSDTATITVNIISSPTVTANASATTVCAGTSVTLTGGGATSYVWTGGVTDGIGFVPTSTNTYTVTGTVTGSCSGTATITVVVNSIPVAIATSNSPVCIGSSINLMAQTVSGATYSWIGPNGFSSASQNPIITSATTADAGTYTLIVSSNGCTSLPSTVSVAVINCGVTADLDIDKTVNIVYPFIGHNVIFTITATNNGPNNATGVTVTDILQGGYTYISSTTTAGTYNSTTGVWTIGNLNNGASEILTVTATVNSTGSYVNTAIISGNETDGNSFNDVSVVETFPTDFFIPEGFSPNGDGTNDVFVIRGIQYYPDNSFTIFNRWGNKVFETTSYKNTWDGKSTLGLRVGGDELPIGTYFYILDLGDGSDVYKGTIYLNR